MNYYEKIWSRKREDKKHFKEKKSQAFRCGHCHAMVVLNEYMGTVNRNHCNFCLWSKHVDISKGDRASLCNAGMQPIGLTFKYEGISKIGELMLIHACTHCPKISINRIAGDDDIYKIRAIFIFSQSINDMFRFRLQRKGINMLDASYRKEVEKQLFGI